MNSEIYIDGYLKESAWKSATKIDNFYTYYPIDGMPAEEKTVALLGFNERSLYVAFICFDKRPELIRATVSSRDDIFNDDHVVLMIDTFNKGKEAYEFAFNPFGIQLDGIYIDMEAEDLNPDYVFYSAGQRFKQGYIVEAEIPFKSLRFPGGSTTWAIAILRSIRHLDMDYIWPPVSRNSTTFVPHFAKIRVSSEISHHSKFEILPEFTSTQSSTLNLDTRELQHGDLQFQGGLNLKYGISSDLTLDLTYNPDFSQIEADADKIDVNRRFPLYYEEKRPFFLEGTSIFQTPINTVYTRQIVDPLAGLKLSGKIGDVEIGLLSGIDNYYGSPEYAETELNFLPSFNDSTYDDIYRGKKSFHNIIRIKKEVWDYSHLGFLLTDRHFGDSYSTTYGIDGKLLIGGEYNFTFQMLNSYTRDPFTSIQKSDPALYASIFRGSRTFNFQLFYTDIFKDFEAVNGFLPYRSFNRPEYREGGLNASYDILLEKSFVRVFRPSLYLTQMFNHSGERIESYIAPTLALEMGGSNHVSLTYYRQFEEYEDFGFNKNWFYTIFDSKTLPWLFLNANMSFGDAIYYESIYERIDPFLGKFQSISFGVDIKPFVNWSTQLSYSNYRLNGVDNNIEYKTIQDILRIRSIYQFSNEISLRVIAEHNNLYKDLDLNLLFSYHPSPGTVLLFGYNDYFDQSFYKNLRRSSRGIFTKISYMFRF